MCVCVLGYIHMCIHSYIYIQYIHTYITDKHVMAAGQGEGAAAPAEPEQERPNPQKGRQGIREVLEQEKQQSLRWEIVIVYVCMYLCIVCMYVWLRFSGVERYSAKFRYVQQLLLTAAERKVFFTYIQYIHNCMGWRLCGRLF